MSSLPNLDLSLYFSNEAILRAARAMLQQDLGHKLTWGQLGEEAQLRYLAGARAALRCGTAEVLNELEKARFEVTQIAIDTSPAYAQMRDERDSARRERDEAMAKLNSPKGTAEVVHVRETTTSTDLLIADGETHHKPGMLIADCSCGDSYYAPAGGDEFSALEREHAAHVRTLGGAR